MDSSHKSFFFFFFALGSDAGQDSNAQMESSGVVGGSLATEGVRTALAQLLHLHGMHVNGLDIGHPPTRGSGGKWH